MTEETKKLIGRLSERKGEIKALMNDIREKKSEKKVLRKLKERKRSITRVMSVVRQFEEEGPAAQET